MNSNIQYRGEVTIKVSGEPKKTRKNSGTSDLFKNICNVLGGMYNDTAHADKLLYNAIPQKINIYYTSPESLVCSSPIRILSRSVVEETDTSSVIFYATLHGSNVSKTTNTSNMRIELQCDDNTPLATSILKTGDQMYGYIKGLQTNSQSQCEIEWKLTFGNATSQSEETT